MPLLFSNNRLCFCLLLFLTVFAVTVADELLLLTVGTTPELKRIVGGTPVESRDTYPFFSVTDPLGCGAFLVSPDILVTAAHCNPAFPRGRTIHIGGLLKNGSDAQDTVTVAETISHPDYVSPLQGDDVMVVRLARASTVTQFAQLNMDVTLPLDTDTVVVIGHGKTSVSGSVSDQLLQVSVPVVDTETCRTDPQYASSVDEVTMLCAGAEGIDSCQGDSGGPLLLGNTVVGITSWGIGCAGANQPGVYARVSNYIDFIQSSICRISATEVPPPFSCEGFTRPANDLCENAEPIAAANMTAQGSNDLATTIGDCDKETSAGVWYTLVGTGETITISTCSSATTFDTILEVFDGDCACSGSSVMKNDDFDCDGDTSTRQSQLEFSATDGQVYHILVVGYNGAVGDFELTVSVEGGEGGGGTETGGEEEEPSEEEEEPEDEGEGPSEEEEESESPDEEADTEADNPTDKCGGFIFCPFWLEFIFNAILVFIDAFFS